MMQVVVTTKKTYDRKETLLLPYHIEFKSILSKFNAKDASYIESYVKETAFSRLDRALLRVPEMNCFVILCGIQDDLTESIARAVRAYRGRCETLVFDMAMFASFSLPDEIIVSMITDACILGSYTSSSDDTMSLSSGGLRNVIINVPEKESERYREMFNQSVQNSEASREARTYGNQTFPENQVDQFIEEFRKGLSRRWKVKVQRMKDLKAYRFSGIIHTSYCSDEEPALITAEHKPEKGKTIALAATIVLPNNVSSAKYHARKHAGSVLRAIAANYAQYERDHSLIIALSIITVNTAKFRQGDVRVASGSTYAVSTPNHLVSTMLADTIYQASRYKPRQIISLTSEIGGFSGFFGAKAAAYISNSDALSKKMDLASKRTREASWRLPLFFHPEASSATRRRFMLKVDGQDAMFMNTRFLEINASGYPWMHLDLSAHAYAYEDDGTQSEGSTGFGAALLNEYLRAVFR